MPINHHHRSHHIIKSFEAEALRKRPMHVKIADFLTSYFGTVGFLILNVILYSAWAYINSGKIAGIPIFDPYPYSFMNSFVSLEALALTITVLMSQNRQNQTASLRNELELQVQLISEREITKILKVLKDDLMEQKKLKPDAELEEMLNDIDAGYIERKLEEQVENSESQPILEIKEIVEEKVDSKK